MNVPLQTFSKRTGPVRPTIIPLVMPYPYRYGMGFLGDDGSGETDTEGSDIPGTSDNSSGETDVTLTDESGNTCLASAFVNGQCPQSAVAATIAAAQAGVTPTTVANTGVIDTLGAGSGGILGGSGNSAIWLDAAGNECLLSEANSSTGMCPVSGSTGPTGASGATTGTTTPGAAAAIASILAAGGKLTSTNVGSGSTQCANGVAVPVGTPCPSASSTSQGIFGCPSGSTYISGFCQAGAAKPAGQWFASMSNTQALMLGSGVFIIGVIVVSAMNGGGGRRRR